MHQDANQTVGFVLARAVVGGAVGFAAGYVLLEILGPRAPSLIPILGLALGSVVSVSSQRPRLRGWNPVVRVTSPLLGGAAGFAVGFLVLFVIGSLMPPKGERLMPGEIPFDQDAYVESLRRLVRAVLAASVILGAVLVTWRTWRAKPQTARLGSGEST